jgi:hypothetical protein
VPYSPDQPRVPAGSSEGGEWTNDADIIRSAARKGAGLPPLYYPKIPVGASALVQYAYTDGLSQLAEGLTPQDRKMLAKGVKTGELLYKVDLSSWSGKKHWVPNILKNMK